MSAGKPTNPLPLTQFMDIRASIDRINAWTREFAGKVDLEGPVKRHMVAAELVDAAARASAKHGNQNHLPDGTGPDLIFEQITTGDDGRILRASEWALECKYRTDQAAAKGKVTWFDILIEEVAEASEQDDLTALRAELADAGAVIINWMIAIDERIEE